MEEEQNTNHISENQTSQNVIQCSCCGSKLVFAPGTLSLKCESCGTINEITVDENAKTEAVKELDLLNDSMIDDSQTEEIHTVKCNSCGAETTFDKNVISSKCDFCGSPLTVNQSSTVKKIKPAAMIPFQLEQHQACELYKRWLKDLWFAPSDLKNSASQTGSLSGVYIPYWTYDAKSTTNYIGERGIWYYTEERYKDSQGQEKIRQVRHTRWSPAFGKVKNAFDDILLSASNTLPSAYLNSLQPWSLGSLVPYDEKFMSGFKAETYSIKVMDGFKTAQKIMEEEIRSTICEDIGGDEQRIGNMDINWYDLTYKHILLPIWISAYKYKDKSYRFVVNGQSGTVRGERPYSVIKIVMAIIAVIAVLTLLFKLLSN